MADLKPDFQNGASSRGEPGGRPTIVLRLADIAGGKISLADTRTLLLRAEASKKYRLRRGDVLVIRVNGSTQLVGRFIVSDVENVAYCDHFIRMRVADEVASPRYLNWLGSSTLVRQQVERAFVSTAGQKTVNQHHIQSIAIPLAPRSEQERIVAAIEQQFSRVDAAVKALRQARRLALAWQSSVLHRSAARLALGAPMRTVGDLASLVTKGTTPTSVGLGFETDGVRFVKVESLQDGRIAHERCSAISQMTHDALARSQLAEQDVLVSIAGTLGTVALVRAEDCPANTNQAIALIRLKDPGYSRVLAAWLRSPVSQRSLRSGAKGVGMNNLTLQQIRGLQVPVADHHASTTFREVEAATRDFTMSLIQAIDAMTRRASNLRLAILSAAFSGNLVPQNPTDEPASALLERTASEPGSSDGQKRHRLGIAKTKIRP